MNTLALHVREVNIAVSQKEGGIMPTGTFKTFFKGFVRRTQSQRDEAYLGKSADLADLEHRQQELARHQLDQRPLASRLAQAQG